MSIVVRELTKTYGALRAVDGVSFDIGSSGLVGLIGPNGAGKSTILRIVSTFLSPTSGRVIVAGRDAAVDPQGVQRNIGYLPENPPGQHEARIEEYLAFRARLKGVDRRDRRNEVDRCLELCQLRPVRRRLIGRLSLGFRRRVGLADALLCAPRVLLLDEPTIGLDPLQIRETRKLLADLAHECVVLLSTHLLAEAEGLCGRILVLLRGRLAADLNIAELRSGSGFEIELCGPRTECERMLASLPQVTSVILLATQGGWHSFMVAAHSARARELAAHQCQERGWGLRELRSTRGTLEDHFVRLAMRGTQEAA
ncbi:MAG: ATP-binding cassette domain-containing protein [Planctomycetia bacterium]|nr:ATP-binding cassette domain-containing protein [Planctomycetia bacterium]